MEKRRRTSYLPEETDEDVSLRVGEFREDEGDEPGVRVCTCIACVNAEREGERERERRAKGEPGAGGCIQVISGSTQISADRVFLDRALNCFG